MGRPRKVRPDWNALATIWTISDELWDVIAPILAEVDPPKATGRPRWMRDARWMRSSSACAAAASGTSCPSASPTTVRSTAPSNAGCGWASSRACGRLSSPRVRSWEGWTGSGKRRMG